MGDFTKVFFPKLGWSFNVPSVAFQFSLFGKIVTIKWYGIIIAFGLTLAVLYGGYMAHKWKINLDHMVDVLIGGLIGGIVGARLFYVIFEWSYYKDHPAEIFMTWEGGLAIYGGIIGALLIAYFICRRRKIDFKDLLDLGGMSFLIGQGIGRWGNFMNQEAFGGNTDLPWGMISTKTTNYLLAQQASLSNSGMSVDPYSPVHPTFLYESVWCLLGFLVLYLICKHMRKFKGQIFLMYCVWYGLERFVVEGLRTDSLYIGNTGVRVSQLISMLIVIAGVVLLVYGFKNQKKLAAKYPVAADGPVSETAKKDDDAKKADDSAEKITDVKAEKNEKNKEENLQMR